MPLVRELEGVAEQVVEDLLEPLGVARHVRASQNRQVAGIPNHFDPFAEAHDVRHVHGLLQDVGHVELGFLQLHLP